MTIIVAGGAGFIGSNFIFHVLDGDKGNLTPALTPINEKQENLSEMATKLEEGKEKISLYREIKAQYNII